MTMKISAAIATIVLCLAASAAESKAYPSIPRQFLQAVYRIKVASIISEMIGSGVGVELDGAKHPRYVLTCAHVILGRDPKTDLFVGSIDVEVVRNRATSWETAEVVAIDISCDLCLLRIDHDLPTTSRIAEKDDLEVGDALLVAGFPEGTSITPSFGYLTGKCQDLILVSSFYSDRFWQASMPVVSGDSGGAVFDPNRNVLVGIIQACLTMSGSKAAAANVTYFVPLGSIKRFLDGAKKKIK